MRKPNKAAFPVPKISHSAKIIGFISLDVCLTWKHFKNNLSKDQINHMPIGILTPF
jgi:hypothetical protein